MTWGDGEVYLIEGYHIYMTDLRAVICPNGKVLLMNREELFDVPWHLQTWKLSIALDIQNQ